MALDVVNGASLYGFKIELPSLIPSLLSWLKIISRKGKVQKKSKQITNVSFMYVCMCRPEMVKC